MSSDATAPMGRGTTLGGAIGGAVVETADGVEGNTDGPAADDGPDAPQAATNSERASIHPCFVIASEN